jgi:hypothetical protein
LLSFGAPWEVPAFFNILEAFKQLNNNAGFTFNTKIQILFHANRSLGSRQIPNASKALVYGNGGIFSASAVAILAKQ